MLKIYTHLIDFLNRPAYNKQIEMTLINTKTQKKILLKTELRSNLR